MFNWNTLKELLIIASFISIICVAFIQKTKMNFSSSKYIPFYSFIINILFAILFCISFTKVKFPMSLWCGFFSYIGADTLYKMFEGKLMSYTQLISPIEDNETNGESNDEQNLEEITYE